MDEDAREMFFQSPRGDRYNTLREELKKDRSLYIRSSQSTCTTFASMKLDVEAPLPCRAHIITDGSNDLRNQLVALIFIDLLDRAGADLLKMVTTNVAAEQDIQLRALDELFSRVASETQKQVKKCGDWTGEGETTMAGVVLFARQFAIARTHCAKFFNYFCQRWQWQVGSRSPHSDHYGYQTVVAYMLRTPRCCYK